ncbi:phage tail sheath C-terminal domain-containing protein [Geobacter grbiciae]|uniref:phage tail sheath C-terminal domain-containing protein n=1 Tax=Geobacter grbiciae TaxID=155042 RepID=UPI001C00A368|nr:phage tail sheath C-terminal domain-containing protein [Geobacter grbiciae]MBT1076109.1 phage tail sheath subtilisin-like domain-containing protein [Geobacter grbiciae]
MPTYLHPGVYVEEIPSGSRPIEGVGTSTAAFVGYTTKGPVAEPTLLFKWSDYEEQFGGIRDLGKSATGDPMGFAVYSFFQNGGTAAYIVRAITEGSADTAEGFLVNPDDATQIIRFAAANPGEWGNDLRIRFEAKADAPGFYTLRAGVMDGTEFKERERFNDLTVADEDAPDYIESKVNDASTLISVEMQAISQYLLGVSISQDLSAVADFSLLNDLTMTVTVDGTARAVTFGATEFSATSTLADVAGSIQTLVRGAVVANPAVRDFTCAADGNQLVLTSGTRLAASAVVVTGPGDATDASTTLLLGLANDGTERTGQQSLDAMLSGIAGQVSLAGGTNGSEPDKAAYDDIFAAFEKVRDISILSLPGQAWDSTTEQSIIDAAVAHAEKMRSRMVIIDPPEGSELRTEKAVNDLGFKPKTYSVVYYPWAKVANPFYNAERNPGVPSTLLVAPSGFAAGMWAKIDGRRGVWKAPAGVETSLLGVAGLQYPVEDGEQDSLNPLGVNCLRKMPGFGPVIWGSRTLATKADPEWRYVPIRRTAIMIEQSIYNGIQWAVFEPNNHNLWASLRANIGSFMDGLFRAGAFQGEKANDAYFVRCGLGDTMTQGDIDRGQVIVIVGFAPLKPAEFVIVRIQQKVAEQ